MCGSFPQSSASHSAGKPPGPIMAALGGLVVVAVFCGTLMVDWIRRRG